MKIYITLLGLPILFVYYFLIKKYGENEDYERYISISPLIIGSIFFCISTLVEYNFQVDLANKIYTTCRVLHYIFFIVGLSLNINLLGRYVRELRNN